jgi:type VI secretion system protein VasI
MQNPNLPALGAHHVVTAVVAVSLWLLGASHPVLASSPACTQIDDDAQRLACYDREFRPKPAPAAETGAGWQVTVADAAAAGEGEARVSRASDSNIACRLIEPRPVVMTVQCKDNVTSISFETGCYMASSEYRDYGYVTYQVDHSEARTAHMIAGPDNHSLGFWSGDTAIPFIRELLGKSRVSVKMTPYADEHVSTAFDLAGLEQAIEPVRSQCGW